MDNKKYLDKVLDHLVRGTKIDYENERVSTPFTSSSSSFRTFVITPLSFLLLLPLLSDYCKNQFGLTKEEIDYVWEIYKDIIKDKIKR